MAGQVGCCSLAPGRVLPAISSSLQARAGKSCMRRKAQTLLVALQAAAAHAKAQPAFEAETEEPDAPPEAMSAQAGPAAAPAAAAAALPASVAPDAPVAAAAELPPPAAAQPANGMSEPTPPSADAADDAAASSEVPHSVQPDAAAAQSRSAEPAPDAMPLPGGLRPGLNAVKRPKAAPKPTLAAGMVRQTATPADRQKQLAADLAVLQVRGSQGSLVCSCCWHA